MSYWAATAGAMAMKASSAAFCSRHGASSGAISAARIRNQTHGGSEATETATKRRVPTRLPVTLTEYASSGASASSIARPSQRPSGTKTSSKPDNITNVRARAEATTAGTKALSVAPTPYQMLTSAMADRAWLMLVRAARVEGISSAAVSAPSTASIRVTPTSRRDVNMPAPRPRKHTTRTVFWRYAKMRTSVPIQRISSSSR